MERDLEEYLYAHIPLSKALGIKVQNASASKVQLYAPLKPNINHKKTVFGGSLHAVATLACWSLLHLNLQKENIQSAQIVIAESNISYILPVDDDFVALASFSDSNKWQQFLKVLKKKGKARIELKATVENDTTVAVDYRATFVALIIG